MSALRWRMDWEIGGYRGSVEDIEVRFLERAAFGPGATSTRRADVSTILPLDLRSIANRLPLTYGRAVLWVNGNPVVTGGWLNPSYEPIAAGARARVSFTVEESIGEDRGSWPPSSDFTPDRSPNDSIGWVNRTQVDVVGDPDTTIFQRDWITTPTWIESTTGNGYELRGIREDFLEVFRADLGLDIPEPSDGAVLPYVFGKPGVTSADDDGNTLYPGAPAYAYEEVLAGPVTYKLGLTVQDTAGASVTPWARDGEGVLAASSTTGTVAMETVASGIRVAYIDQADVTGDPMDGYGGSTDAARRTHLGDRFFVSWESSAASGLAGDVIESCLSFTSLRIDRDSVMAAKGWLNGYELAGYIDVKSTPLEYIQRQLAPLLGITLSLGPRGIQVVLPPWSSEMHANATPIVQGQGVSRVGRSVEYLQVEESRGVILEFAKRADNQMPTRSVSAEAFDNAYANFGRAKGIVRIVADCVASQTTANRIAREQAIVRSWTPRAVPYYITNRDRYGIGGTHELFIGQRVALTDSFLGFESKAAFVGEIERGRTEIVTLYLIDDPLMGD